MLFFLHFYQYLFKLGLVVSAHLYIGKTHITVTKIRISIKYTLFFDNSLIFLCTLYFAYQHTSCSNYHHMYVTVLVWVKIQFDWKQIPFKYKTRKKKIDGNNGKEKVPRKSEKMPKY